MIEVARWSETFEVWQKGAFSDASRKSKLLFFYIVTNCDCIGVFEQSLRVVSFQIGEQVSEEDILSIPADIERIGEGKFWLSKFCSFQYGELSGDCRPHKKYVSELKKRGLLERVCKGYAKGIHTLQEKEKEKEEEKEEDGEESEEGPRSLADGGDSLSPDDVKAKVGEIVPEWAKPAVWNHAEDRALMSSLDSFRSLGEDDWRSLRRWVREKRKDGQWPRTRSQLCENLSDCLQQALGKNSAQHNGKPPPVHKGVDTTGREKRFDLSKPLVLKRHQKNHE